MSMAGPAPENRRAQVSIHAFPLSLSCFWLVPENTGFYIVYTFPFSLFLWVFGKLGIYDLDIFFWYSGWVYTILLRALPIGYIRLHLVYTISVILAGWVYTGFIHEIS